MIRDHWAIENGLHWVLDMLFLLLTVIGWVICLFCGFGLMSKVSPMPVIILAVGAIAIASAVLLILDLSNPYQGAFRASPAPLEAGPGLKAGSLVFTRPSRPLAAVEMGDRTREIADFAWAGIEKL